MKKFNTKNDAKSKAVAMVSAVLTKELENSAKTAGSLLGFQPKAPEGLKRFKK
ncbi:MAG: cyclic lactone autoinducer peptide [Roseburia sp.]|nr:cyclic lactone autoinducer peptide [Roseburia sp.]